MLHSGTQLNNIFLTKFSIAGSVGFEPTTYSRIIDWKKFEEYLRANKCKRAIGHYMNLAKEYNSVLTTSNASVLLTLSQGRRKHAMLSLTHLSKFIGVRKQWRETIENYGLKWKSKQVLNPLQRTNITEMVAYLKEVRTIAPEDIWNSFLFDVLTGLRASESLNAIRLIQQNAEGYYNEESDVIEHHKFQELFIRNSKNAYFSVMTPELIEIAKRATPAYYRIRMWLRKNNKPMLMKYCRKIFATWLRQHGIEREDIDLLQGRVGQSIFVQHYYSPDINALIEKVKPILEELKQEIN